MAKQGEVHLDLRALFTDGRRVVWAGARAGQSWVFGLKLTRGGRTRGWPTGFGLVVTERDSKASVQLAVANPEVCPSGGGQGF